MGKAWDPIPDHLVRGAHSRRDLLAAGLTVSELTGPLWRRLDRGRYAWAASDPPSLMDRIRQAVPLLPPQAVIGGWAAAMIHGVTGLDGESADGRPWPVQLCLSRHQTCRRSAGVTIIRSDIDPVDRTVVDGIPVTSLVRTAFDIMRLDPSTARPGRGRACLEESVIWADAMLRDTGLDAFELAAYLNDRNRRRGVPQARRALELADRRSASPQETRFRLLWILDAKLPPPVPNVTILDRNGRLRAVADLFDPEAALCGEYDGEFHASPQRRSKDLGRAVDLGELGIEVFRITSFDLTDRRSRTIARLRERHQAGLARDRGGDRWICDLS